ncbi:HAD family hydrolase [Gordonia amicalis]|uniref:HAD-IA family hydrolase n=1 Tax=Gordonia amicalis TaxID=89053 RepID=A0AAE4R2I6_9ACTN|nr:MULTISPECIES: HAD-IA family hydrolase [Gordonia]ATD70230.1 haloacid dehalogenase [Gordonia sp. 1D]MBA5849140.1 HAD-IA family hydrolase [Gordonia amicalis]MDV6306745.1 HAD-IA family hydrolase [Gordonia amicalis]MDV6310942.1 HAD-IA family hydrolase [Gordonia amicalis]MDV7099065.1 HAD-IA family hydrolase [Gordonia amicalis]
MTPDLVDRASTPRAVLFDFSGTLFRFEARDDWFVDLLDDAGEAFVPERQADIIRRMVAPVGLPEGIEGDDRTAWERRDLDPELHRVGYLALLRTVGMSNAGHANSLYDRVLDPESWVPFADTVEVLTRLADTGVPIGIVSNIAFDLRKVLALHGIDHLVDAYALSYEVGAIKPEPRLFRAALDPIGVPAGDVLMVGDSVKADGGARALGCSFALVHDVPPADRPTALLDAVAAHGIELRD